MPQFARPSSDIATGAWVATPAGALWPTINDATADATYITETGLPSVFPATVGLNSVTDPGVDTGFQFGVRFRTTSIGGNITLTLRQGPTLIEAVTVATTAGGFNTYTLPLAPANIAGISDFSNLRIDIARAAVIVDTDISALWLEVPDVVAVGSFTTHVPLSSHKGEAFDYPAGGRGGRWDEPLFTFHFSSVGSPSGVLMWGAEPVSREDALGAQRCAFSGLLFPARMIVVVDGAAYGAPYAPRPSHRHKHGLEM